MLLLAMRYQTRSAETLRSEQRKVLANMRKTFPGCASSAPRARDQKLQLCFVRHCDCSLIN